MKFQSPMLVVADMEAAKAFYARVLGLRVEVDFGANVTLTGGIALQTLDTWRHFIGAREDEVRFGGLDKELYFEEDDFDAFLAHLQGMQEVRLVHPCVEHSWGQRAVRFFDPDGHVIEVGENMRSVCRRFVAGGLTPEETAKRMDVPLSYVMECLN